VARDVSEQLMVLVVCRDLPWEGNPGSFGLDTRNLEMSEAKPDVEHNITPWFPNCVQKYGVPKGRPPYPPIVGNFATPADLITDQ